MTRGIVLTILGVAFLVAAPVTAVVAPDSTALPSVLGGLAAACLVVALVLERRSLAAAARGRAARHGLLAAGYSLSVLVLLGAVAFLASRHALRVDLTAERLHSLSDETKVVLDSIPDGSDPVEVLLLDSAQVAAGTIVPLARRLSEGSSRLAVRTADALRDPALARSLAVERFPAAVVSWQPPGGASRRIHRTHVVTEKAIAQGIRQVLEGKQPIAYVTAGHGEMALADRSPAGLAVAGRLLLEDNFEVRQLILGSESPADAALLIVAGPEADFLPPEIESLERHLRQGGRILMLLGPTPQPGALVALSEWLRKTLGILVQDDLVADLDGLQAGAKETLLVSPPGGEHPIARHLDKRMVLPLSRSVGREPFLPEGALVTTLLSSGPRSWIETDFSQPPSYDGSEPKGPHAVAVAATFTPSGQEVEGRLVVLGSSRWADNATLPVAGNQELFRAAVLWLTSQEEVLAAAKSSSRDTTMVVSQAQGMLLMFASAAVPLVVLLAGLATWLHRRRL